jgi:hypothetical protein
MFKLISSQENANKVQNERFQHVPIRLANFIKKKQTTFQMLDRIVGDSDL